MSETRRVPPNEDEFNAITKPFDTSTMHSASTSPIYHEFDPLYPPLEHISDSPIRATNENPHFLLTDPYPNGIDEKTFSETYAVDEKFAYDLTDPIEEEEDTGELVEDSTEESQAAVWKRRLPYLIGIIIIVGGVSFALLWNFLFGVDKYTTISPDVLLSEFEGWGCSLAWWAEYVGTLELTKQDKIVNRLFSQSSEDSLKMNIVRFNIGGSGPHDPVTGLTPSDSRLKEWKGVPSFLNEKGEYDWSADDAQVTIMRRAIEMGADILEAFSNSPPWFMTKSKSSRGAQDGKDNLDPSNFKAFADYLAEFANESINRWGITFQYIQPFNEPNSNWWNNETQTQEGCAFSPEAQDAFVPILKRALDQRGIGNNTKIAVGDANSIDAAVRNIDGGAGFDSADKVSVHGYGDSINGNVAIRQEWWNKLRLRFRDSIPSRIRRVWMSEVGGFGQGTESLTNLASSIVQDMNIMRVSSWIYWQPLDPHPAWTLFLHAEDAIWDFRAEKFNPKPVIAFFVLQQFSAHIRPKDRILATSRAGQLAACVTCVVVSYSKRDRRLTIVAANIASSTVDHTFDLSQLGNQPSASVRAVYRTCEKTQENHALIGANDRMLSRVANAASPLPLNVSNLFSPDKTKLVIDLLGFSVTTIILDSIVLA